MNKYRNKLSAHPSVQPYLFDSVTPQLDKLSLALRTLAEEGPEAFYSGSIARSIHQDMASNGGWIVVDDLKSFPDPEEVSSVHFTYKGYDLFSQTRTLWEDG